MLIVWRLLLSHLLADFTFQSDYINRWKRQSFLGLLAHCAIHFLIAVALLFPYLNMIWIDAGSVKLQGWTCLLAIMFIHLMEDHWRIFSMRKFHTSDSIAHFLWDQVIHISAILALSPVYGMGVGGSFFPEKWVVLACLFVCVTHALTVLIYFLEKDMDGAEFPLFDEKYLGMVERLVLWGFMLLPGYWWIPFLLLWLAHIAYLRKKRILDFSKAGLYVGLFCTFILGLAARAIIY